MPDISSGVRYDTLGIVKKVCKGNNAFSLLGFSMVPPVEMHPATQRFDAAQCKASVSADGQTIVVSKDTDPGSTSGFRFLKWTEERCTGFVADPGARVVMSGLFGGCCFYMAKDPVSGSPVFMHANSNANQAKPNRPDTLRRQSEYMESYLARYNAGVKPLYHVGYEQMGRVGSWIIAVDKNGDQRHWEIFTVPVASKAIAARKVGACLLL